MRDTQPPLLHPPYLATRKRSPRRELVALPETLSELTGPLFEPGDIAEGENDLTRHPDGEPQGQLILVGGRVLDENARPVPHTLVEIWQANAAGRYRHDRDTFGAPLDPFFIGSGRALTDGEGRYRFVTIRPGPYPWRNHPNAWRPAHIHFSVYGPAFATRLVTQMYFEGDPLLSLDPIFNSIADDEARSHLVARLDWDSSEEFHALAYRFDVTLRSTASQTAGPYFGLGLSWGYVDTLVTPDTVGERVAVEGRLLDGDGAPVSDGVLEIWQANAHGRYVHPDDTQPKPLDPAFKGYGRVPTNADGAFRVTTIVPGAVPGPDGRSQAPHLAVSVLARGLLRRLATRMYFPPAESDPVLERVPPERRRTLIARPGSDGVVEWNVILQGEDETVFFDC